MLQTKGILVGSGVVPWTSRETGVESERLRIAISSGVVTALPDLYEAEPDALKQAQSLPYGCEVLVELGMNRWKQVAIKTIRKAN